MSQYINKKQLAFLVFIIIALWAGRYFRPSDTKEAANIQVSSTLQDSIRVLPYRLSAIALCQQQCRSLSDSSLALIIQYGAIVREQGQIHLQGNDLQGTLFHLHGVVESATFLTQEIAMPYSSYHCPCPTTEQQGAE